MHAPAQAPEAARRLRVMHFPDYRRANPYQRLLAKGIEANGAEVLFPQGYRRVFPLSRALRATSPRPDVLHLHWYNPYVRSDWLVPRLGFVAKFFADLRQVRAMGIRLVWTIHNLVDHEAPFFAVERFVNRRLGSLADGIIVHSESAAAAVAQTYGIPRDRLTVIPHGHYRSCYAPAQEPASAREALGLPLEGRVILFLGLLRPYKGVEALLDAWRGLCREPEASDTTLVIAGRALNEAYEAALRARADDLPRLVFHPEFVEAEEMPRYFGAATLAVLPFNRILTSGSLLLAMSFNTPVVAPALPPVREALGEADGGLLYDPEAPNGLREALRHALRRDLTPLRAEIARRCDALDWDKLGADVVALYRRACGRAPAPKSGAQLAR